MKLHQADLLCKLVLDLLELDSLLDLGDELVFHAGGLEAQVFIDLVFEQLVRHSELFVSYQTVFHLVVVIVNLNSQFDHHLLDLGVVLLELAKLLCLKHGLRQIIDSLVRNLSSVNGIDISEQE